MVVRRRKKVVKYRGSKTHGGGAMKKRRGAGHRGGRGMSATGKKADAKKPSIWHIPHYLGKFGFKKKNIKVIYKSISMREVEDRLPTLLRDGKVKKEGNLFVLNLEDIGYNKLLSNGRITKKWKISSPYASEGAKEKLKEAGGELLGLEEKVEKKPSEDKKAKPEESEE